MTVQEMLLIAVPEAQLILARHIEPGNRDADKTINKLLSVLDRFELVEAAVRLEGALGLRFRIESSPSPFALGTYARQIGTCEIALNWTRSATLMRSGCRSTILGS